MACRAVVGNQVDRTSILLLIDMARFPSETILAHHTQRGKWLAWWCCGGGHRGTIQRW